MGPPDDSDIVPGAAARTTIQNLSSVYEGKIVDIRTRVTDSVETPKPHQFPVRWARGTVVTCVCRFGVRPTPYEYLVVVDLGIMPVLERERKVGVES